MASIIDYLYELTPRDQQVTPFELVSININGSTAGASLVTSTYTVPQGRILVVSSCLVSIQCGVGSKPRNALVESTDTQSVAVGLFAKNYQVLANNTHIDANSFNEVWCGPGDVIDGYCEWDTAVAGNALSVTVRGILIPRGNVAV